MIIKQNITTRIKLSTNDVLTFNNFKTFDEMLLDNIAKIYLNKCFKEVFILKINKIISRSRVLENVYDINAGDFVDATFEITGEIFTEREIIPKCKLVKIQTFGRYDCIVEDKPYIKIAINEHEIIKHYEVGDCFPCIIGHASLKTISDSVIIKAIPFCSQYSIRTYLILDNKTEIFKSVTALKDIDDNMSVASSHRKKKEWYEHSTYGNINNDITNLYNENITKPNFKFFLDFMKIEDLTDKVSDLKKWNEINIGDYVKTNPTNYNKTVKVTNPDNMAVQIKQKEFLLKMLKEQLIFLNNVKDLSESYTNEEIKKYKQTWDNYSKVVALKDNF